MNDNTPKRRWFQYSLRSVLLLMLGVALWLGYEVNWASRQQRRVAAITDLGGSVEFDSSGWSLLRRLDPATYGRRIVHADIHGGTIPEAVAHFQNMPALRRLRVRYDGSCDLHPYLDRLHAALPAVKITPVAEELPLVRESVSGQIVNSSARRKMVSRIVSKAQQFRGKDCASLHYCAKQWESPTGLYKLFAYHLVRLSDGPLAELIVVTDRVFLTPADQESVSVLIVGNLVVDWRRVAVGTRFGRQNVVLEDLDGDGHLDLGYEYTGPRMGRLASLSGDSRKWLDADRITSNGFRSLVPQQQPPTSN